MCEVSLKEPLRLTDHVCIRRPEYVSGSRERPEVKVFTQTHQTRHPLPWGSIDAGDTVWMKWAGGPIVANSKVNGFRQIEDCTPDQLRTAAADSLLAQANHYFDSLPPAFDAVVIYLQDEHWLDAPLIPRLRSRGESWIVLRDEESKRGWLAADSSQWTASIPPSRTTSGRTRSLSYSTRFAVLRRAGFTCKYCGRKPPEVRLHVDHVVPWSKGGSNHIDNLCAACDVCNLGKGASAAA